MYRKLIHGVNQSLPLISLYVNPRFLKVYMPRNACMRQPFVDTYLLKKYVVVLIVDEDGKGLYNVTSNFQLTDV